VSTAVGGAPAVAAAEAAAGDAAIVAVV